MEIVVILLMGLLVLNGAVWRCWGFDSRDSWNSAEWERRNWRAFH